jgi:hypothetical protein
LAQPTVAFPTHRCLYSFVVDGAPRFARQAQIFVATLRQTGVEADDIIAHVTPSAAAEIVQHLERGGIRAVPLTPVIDGAYCNKIAQIQTLVTLDYETLILCDTDLAFVENLSAMAGTARIRAKPVDYQNPPIDKLDTLRRMVGIAATPRIVETTVDHRPTYSTNCNGGVYILPIEAARRLQDKWLEFAAFAATRSDVLGPHLPHADQIGFALAMLALSEDVDDLPVEYNFPVSVSRDFWRFVFSEPKVLHYHNVLDEDGRLVRTGNRRVDRSIDQVNRIIATI